MNNNQIIGAVIALMLVLAFISGSNYYDNKANIAKANSGLEECLKNPTWSAKGTLWVKDCSKYMADWKAAQ